MTGFLTENLHIDCNVDSLRAIIYSWTGLILDNLTTIDARWINNNHGNLNANPFGIKSSRAKMILCVLEKIITHFCGVDPDEKLKPEDANFTIYPPASYVSLTWDHRAEKLPSGESAGRKKKVISSLLRSQNMVLLFDEMLKAKPLAGPTDQVRTHNQFNHATEHGIPRTDLDTIRPNYNPPSLEDYHEGRRPSSYY